MPVKAMIINFPNNPTGTTYTRSEIKKLVQLIKKYDIFIDGDNGDNDDPFALLGDLAPMPPKK